jgi:hypothetical protein
LSCGKGELEGDEDADQEAHDAPEGRGDHPGPDHAVHVGEAVVARDPVLVRPPERPEEEAARDQHDDDGMDHVGHVAREVRRDGGEERDQPSTISLR